jgi:hypothetical protein
MLQPVWSDRKLGQPGFDGGPTLKPPHGWLLDQCIGSPLYQRMV